MNYTSSAFTQPVPGQTVDYLSAFCSFLATWNAELLELSKTSMIEKEKVKGAKSLPLVSLVESVNSLKGDIQAAKVEPEKNSSSKSEKRTGEVAAPKFRLLTHPYRYQSLRHHIRFNQIISEKALGNGTDAFCSLASNMLGFLKEIFGSITGSACATSLKTYDHRAGAVTTIARCSESAATRNRYTPTYHYSTDDALAYIIENEAHFFVSDDLASFTDKANRPYNNRDLPWNEHYNARLVVPIEHPTESTVSGGRSTKVVGFILVDNFDGGLDNAAAIELLQAFANLCFPLCDIFSSK